MVNYKGLDYLRAKQKARATRVNDRYEYYDMKNQEPLISMAVPRQLQQHYRATSGWCARAVDALADRLAFREFGNDTFKFGEIYAQNNADVLFDSAIHSALVSSCSFIYIVPGEGYPRMRVLDGGHATGIIDPITNLLTEGYAVLEVDENGYPTLEAYFLPHETRYYTAGIAAPRVVRHASPYPLLVPIIHRPDAKRPFGRSRISRSAMYWQAYAKRTVERSDLTAEFYSFPQKYVLGLSQEAEKIDTWKATMSAMLSFEKDEAGDAPKVGQFTTPSMQPFIEQFRMAASGFAGETGLTLDDLGFVSDNPSSSEAIKASHETLRIMARKAQRSFASGFLNAGYLAACRRDGMSSTRDKIHLTTVKWEPLFEPDASSLGLVGDGVFKINQAVPGYVDKGSMEDLTGIKGAG